MLSPTSGKPQAPPPLAPVLLTGRIVCQPLESTLEKRTAVWKRRKAKRLLAHSEGDRALSAAPRLRRLVADTILASPDTYSEVVLGKPPREYAEWIVDPQHWGGQIELTVRARLEENFSIAFQF